MKKILCLASIIALAACQAPINRNIYQATGPRVCYEYYDSFRCVTPTRVWNRTIYPKNEAQMQYGYDGYIPYQQQSLSQAIYGTM
jgi:hypothetical protein